MLGCAMLYLGYKNTLPIFKDIRIAFFLFMNYINANCTFKDLKISNVLLFFRPSFF